MDGCPLQGWRGWWKWCFGCKVKMELFWEQRPRGQSLNLPVKVGAGELQGLAKARCAVRQQQLFASKQEPHGCRAAREDGFYSRKAAGGGLEPKCLSLLSAHQPCVLPTGLCWMNHHALTCNNMFFKFFFSLSSIFKPLRLPFDYAFSASRSALKAGAL